MTENKETENTAQKTRDWGEIGKISGVLLVVVLLGAAMRHTNFGHAVESMLTEPVDDAIGYTYWDKFNAHQTDNWNHYDYERALLASPAFQNHNVEAISQIQEQINSYLLDKKKPSIGVDGLVGRETLQSFHDLSYEEKIAILQSNKRVLNEASENLGVTETTVEKVSASGIVVGESLEPPPNNISNSDTLQLRNALWHRWAKNQYNDNPEVRIFQKAVNKLLGKEALVVDGKKGWRTDTMLFEMPSEQFTELLKMPEIEKILQKDPSIKQIIHKTNSEGSKIIYNDVKQRIY